MFLFCFPLVQLLSAQWRKSGQSQTRQNIDKTIENANRLLGSNCKMEFDKELIITFFEQGLPFREDRVYLDALDLHNVQYVPEEKAVSVQCIEFKGLTGVILNRYGEGCILREFVKDKQVLFYSRIVFPVTNEQAAGDLKLELVNLIRYGHELLFK